MFGIGVGEAGFKEGFTEVGKAADEAKPSPSLGGWDVI